MKINRFIYSNKYLCDKIIILLTATIDPKGMIYLRRSDPNIREKDYICALKYYLEHTYQKIVFVENSNYNLEKIYNLVEKYPKERVEILQFNGNDFPRELGKGYGELKIIDYALKNSTYIKENSLVLKINGRLIVKNILLIIKEISKYEDVYVCVDLYRGLTFADSRIFFFKPGFIINYLLRFHNVINDSKGIVFEDILAKATLLSIADGRKWLPIVIRPRIFGYSGGKNIRYNEFIFWYFIKNIKNRLKNYLIL